MTAGEVKRSLHRAVQQYASEHATPVWRGKEIRANWSERNLAAVERLAQHVLALPDDDPRFAAVAAAYTGHEWRLAEPHPWDPALSGWLGLLGGSSDRAAVLSHPAEFISRWSTVTLDQARAWTCKPSVPTLGAMMTPEEARQIVAQSGVRWGSLDSMARELTEAPTLLALLSMGEALEDAQRIAHDRASEFAEHVSRLQRGEGDD